MDFNGFLEGLSDLRTTGTAAHPENNLEELHKNALAMADLLSKSENIDHETLAGAISAHPEWFPLFASCVGLGKEQLKRQLKFKLKTEGWKTLAQKNPGILIDFLAENFGLIAVIDEQRKRNWSFADILLERAKWSHGLASDSVRRGRSLENDIETIVRDMGFPYEMRTRFVGLRGKEAPCDLAIPGGMERARIVGAVKGFNSTGSKLSDAVREVEDMAMTRLPRQFVFAFVDGIGWLGRKKDLKRIFDLWKEKSIDVSIHKLNETRLIHFRGF